MFVFTCILMIDFTYSFGNYCALIQKYVFFIPLAFLRVSPAAVFTKSS